MPRVTGIKAILAIYEDDVLTWTNPAQRQTPVIVTYNFSTGAKLNKFGDSKPASADYFKFNEAQRENFRDAADKISAVSGVVFVEVKGRAMINIARGEGTDTGGFASYPVTGNTFSDSFFSEFVVDGTGSFNEGSYEFLTMLHELGHAVGLSHPHEGRLRLTNGTDNLSHTVMTYNNSTGGNSFPSKLGTLDVKALKFLYGGPNNTKGWTFKQGADAFKIAGSGRGDEIFGIAGKNSIDGKGGADKLIGRDFADDLFGGAGGDTLNGNHGQDMLKGEAGNDTLKGGNSTDELFGGDGADQLFGGDGDDKLAGGNNGDSLFGGGDNDTLSGGNGNDSLFGDDGGDTLYGGAGGDELTGGRHDDALFGGASNDMLDGGAGDDTLSGGAGDDTLIGGNNSDDLFGNSGQDTLIGGGGNDNLFGGASNDELNAGIGQNFVTGGLGNDTFVFEDGNNANAKTYVQDFEAGADVIDLTDFGTNYAALVISDSGNGARIVLSDGADIFLAGYDAIDVLDSFFDF